MVASQVSSRLLYVIVVVAMLFSPLSGLIPLPAVGAPAVSLPLDESIADSMPIDSSEALAGSSQPAIAEQSTSVITSTAITGCYSETPAKSKACEQSRSTQAPLSTQWVYGSPLSFDVSDNTSTGIYYSGLQQFYGGNAEGVFIWVNGSVYGPGYVPAGSATNAYTPRGNTLSGTGTSSNPWKITTLVDVGTTGLRIQQEIRYVNGDSFVSYSWRVYNMSGQAISYSLFHAADLYTANNDFGYGYYDGSTDAIGGYNVNRSFYQYFRPVTGGSYYFESYYADVWQRIGSTSGPGAGFNNTFRPNDYIDNGAGLQWNRTVQSGGVDLISDYGVFNTQIGSTEPGRSSIQVSPTSVPADGTSVATVLVTLRDVNGYRLPGRRVRVISSRQNMDIFGSSTGTTDVNGQFATTFRSYTPGSAIVTAQDFVVGQTLAASAQVNFIPVGGGTIPPINSGPIRIVAIEDTLPLSGIYPTTNDPILRTIFGNNFRNRVNVVVDWGGSQPGWVDLILNGTKQRVAANASGASFELDMSRDLRSGLNDLRITAYNAIGKSSLTEARFPVTFSLPAWLVEILNLASDTSVEMITTHPRAVNIWFRIPPKTFLSEVNLGPGSMQTEGLQAFARLQIPLEGNGDIDIRAGARYLSETERHRAAGANRKGLSIFGTEFTWDGYAFSRLHLNNYELESAKVGGGTELKVSNEWRKSWLVVLTFLGIPPMVTDAVEAIPMLGDFIADRAFLYLKLTGKLGADFTYQMEPQRRFDSFDIIGGLEAEVGAKFDVVVELKVYAGGGLEVTLVCVRNTSEDDITGNAFCNATANFKAGVELKALFWEKSFEWVAEKHWPDILREGQAKTLIRSPQETAWHLIDHPSNKDYALYRADSGKQQAFARVHALAPSGIAAQTTITSMLVSNAYTYTEPALAINPSDNTALLLWVHDDINKPVGQSQEIEFSRWNGSAWSVPTGVTDDNLLDGAPHIAWDSNGGGVAVWERLNDTLPITATWDVTTAKKIEIATSIYSPTINAWSPVALVTNNTALDMKPQLARNNVGNLLAVWRQNDAGLLGGTITDTDRIMSAFYASGWITPSAAVDNIPGLVDLAAGYGNGEAVVAYTRYLTPTGYPTPTLQLFTTTWAGNTWASPIQRTDDSLGHRNPQVVYNSSNQPLLVWLAGNELRLQNLATNATVTLTLESGTVIDEFRIVQDGTGNIAAVFTAQTSQRDLFVAFYDQVNNVWSRPRQLTDDRASEAYPSAGMDSTGRLLMGYATTAIMSITQTTTISGTGEVITFTLPTEGQTDLLTLSHEFTRDLGISDADVTRSDDHPFPGSTVVLTATIHNLGDLPIGNIPVDFYDGDPASGGTLIDTVTWPGPLAGGFTATLTTTYAIPTTGGQRQLYVVIDRSNTIAESNETNNAAMLTAFGPDLTIVGAYAESWGGSDVGLVSIIQNLGTTTAPTSTLAFYQTSITGTLLATDVVPALIAGGTITLTTPWNFSELPEGSYPIVAAVNPAQIDFAETFTTNNTAELAIDVRPDLAVNPLYFWADRQLDGQLIITGTVYNFGSITATNVVAAVYASDPLTDTNRLFTTTIAALPPGGSAEITGTWNAPTSGYSLYLWADPDAVITETTRANNLASQAADYGFDMQPIPDAIVRGETTVYTLTLNSRNGFAAPIGLTATGAPTGAMYLLGNNLITPTTSIPLTITTDETTPEGNYPLIIEAVSGNLTHTLAITVNIVAPDFTPFVLPETQTLVQGETVAYSVALAPYHGFNSPVTLTVTGLPTGTSVIIVPNPITPTVNAVITITAADTATVGTFPITITASSGVMTRTTMANLTIVAAARDLYVSKSLNSGIPFADSNIQYRVYYQLTGNSAATDVVITDTLPLSTTYVSDIDAPGFTTVITGSTVVWHKPIVAPGESGDLYLTVHIAGDVAADTWLTNTAQITNTRAETNYANNVYTYTLTAQTPIRDMYISKWLSGGDATPGNRLYYGIYFSNQGNSTASDVILTDTLPLSTSYVSWSGYSYNPSYRDLVQTITPTIVGNQIVWNLGSVEANGYGYIYPVVRLSPTAPIGAPVNNTAQISTRQAESDYSNNRAVDSRVVFTNTVDVAIAKTLLGSTLANGSEATYLIDYYNNSLSAASHVVITDGLPTGLSYVSAAGAVSPTLIGDALVWNLDAVPGHTSDTLTLTVFVSDSLAIGSLLTNTVMINAANDNYGYNNFASDVHSVAAATRDLYVNTWISGGTSEAGSVITYALAYGNDGNASAADATITDTLPVSLTFVSALGPVTPTVIGQHVVWRLGILPAQYVPGYAGTLYLTARINDNVPSGTLLTNNVAISTRQIETTYSNNNSTVTIVSLPPWGGPDAFGYTFKDSTMSGGPTFTWLDATDGITSSVTGDDSYGGPFPIGFSFPFYGNSYTDLYFSTNGLVTLGTPSSSYDTTNLPNPDIPNNLLAVLWDDLQVYSPQAIFYKRGGTSPNRFFAVEWYNVSRLSDPSHPITFEVVIYESGKMVFQYLSLSGTQDTNTVGIENSTGTIGLQYTYNQARLSDNLAIEFSPPRSATSLNAVSINGPTTGNLNTTYTFTATVTPLTATLPITYTWLPAPNSGQGTAAATYSWSTTGAKLITVTARNVGSAVVDTHIITISAPPAIVPVQSVTISGPLIGTVNATYAFTATVAPPTATLPFTYTWSPTPISGQGTAVAAYTWTTTGTKTITVTAQNAGGNTTDTHLVTIVDGVLTTVGSAGATLIYTDAHGLTLTIQIPPNAVVQTTSLVYTPLATVTAPSGVVLAGRAFELNAYQNGSLVPAFTFNSPVTITIHYADTDVAGLDEDTLALRYWTGSLWADAACGAYDRHPAQNWLAVPLCHLSRFAVFGSGYKIYLPLTSRNH